MRVISLLAAAAALAACGDGAAEGRAGAPATSTVGSAPAAQARPAGPPARTEIREFRDWRAVCDNGNGCVAWTGSNEGGWLRIAIEAGPDARPSVTASSWALSDDGTAPDDLGLRIDSKAFAVRSVPGGVDASAGDERLAREIIAALASGRSLTLTSGDQSVDLSTSGASATLLWIDERQGRLGTTTALLRRGERPASAVPSAPALPRVTPAPAVSQTGFEGGANPMEEEPRGLRVPAAIEARQEVKDCRAENNEYLDKATLAARLDGRTILWGIPCGSGAYNATYVLYLADPDGGNARPAELPTREPRPEDDEGDLWLVNPVYDPETQTLTVFPRGRGLGDCGTIQAWTWTAGGGFALTEERVMGDCQGMTPEHWPTTWRTRSG